MLRGGIVGSSGSGKTRFWLTPQLLQTHSSYCGGRPQGRGAVPSGLFSPEEKGYKIKVFKSIDFLRSMHYNYNRK